MSLVVFGCKNSQQEQEKQPNSVNENLISLTKEQLQNFQLSTTELQEKNNPSHAETERHHRCATTKFSFCQQCFRGQGTIHQTIARDAF